MINERRTYHWKSK